MGNDGSNEKSLEVAQSLDESATISSRSNEDEPLAKRIKIAPSNSETQSSLVQEYSPLLGNSYSEAQGPSKSPPPSSVPKLESSQTNETDNGHLQSPSFQNVQSIKQETEAPKQELVASQSPSAFAGEAATSLTSTTLATVAPASVFAPSETKSVDVSAPRTSATATAVAQPNEASKAPDVAAVPAAVASSSAHVATPAPTDTRISITSEAGTATTSVTGAPSKVAPTATGSHETNDAAPATVPAPATTSVPAPAATTKASCTVVVQATGNPSGVAPSPTMSTAAPGSASQAQTPVSATCASAPTATSAAPASASATTTSTPEPTTEGASSGLSVVTTSTTSSASNPGSPLPTRDSEAATEAATTSSRAPAIPMRSTKMSHLRDKYKGELEYMLREFRKLEDMLLGAKGTRQVGASQVEESAGSRERREKLHSFILHLEDTIGQIEVGCKLEAEGKSTAAVGVSNDSSAGDDAESKVNGDADTAKARAEEENVQRLDEHILANLLPVKERLKKQLTAQQGASRNPAGMPATRRGMLQPSAAADRGKGTFIAAVEQRRKQAEAARLAAQQQEQHHVSLSSDSSQFGKPLKGGGSSLTQKLHGATLGSKDRKEGHGVGSAQAAAASASEPAESKIIKAGMVPGSSQIMSGVKAATQHHEMVVENPSLLQKPAETEVVKSDSPPQVIRSASVAVAPPAPSLPQTKAVELPTPESQPPSSSLPVSSSSVSASDKAEHTSVVMTDVDRKKIRKERRKKKLLRLAKRRERERQRQIALNQQAAQATQVPGKVSTGRKKAAMTKVHGKKKGPRSVEYICALCSESYSSSCDYNPWWALAQHECPKCRKNQIPRIDITSPANAIEYHPALLAHADDNGGAVESSNVSVTDSSQANVPPSSTFPMKSTMTPAKYPAPYASESDSESDLSELSDDPLSDDSDVDDSTNDLQAMTPAEKAEHEKFGHDYKGPKFSDETAARLLVLMSHAVTCPCRHKNTQHKDVCRNAKYLLLHVRDCPGTTSTFDVCPFPWCRKTKHLLYHLVTCISPSECSICSPTFLSRNLYALTGLNEFRQKKHREKLLAAARTAKRTQQSIVSSADMAMHEKNISAGQKSTRQYSVGSSSSVPSSCKSSSYITIQQAVPQAVTKPSSSPAVATLPPAVMASSESPNTGQTPNNNRASPTFSKPSQNPGLQVQTQTSQAPAIPVCSTAANPENIPVVSQSQKSASHFAGEQLSKNVTHPQSTFTVQLHRDQSELSSASVAPTSIAQTQSVTPEANSDAVSHAAEQSISSSSNPNEPVIQDSSTNSADLEPSTNPNAKMQTLVTTSLSEAQPAHALFPSTSSHAKSMPQDAQSLSIPAIPVASATTPGAQVVTNHSTKPEPYIAAVSLPATDTASEKPIVASVAVASEPVTNEPVESMATETVEFMANESAEPMVTSPVAAESVAPAVPEPVAPAVPEPTAHVAPEPTAHVAPEPTAHVAPEPTAHVAPDASASFTESIGTAITGKVAPVVGDLASPAAVAGTSELPAAEAPAALKSPTVSVVPTVETRPTVPASPSAVSYLAPAIPADPLASSASNARSALDASESASPPAPAETEQVLLEVAGSQQAPRTAEFTAVKNEAEAGTSVVLIKQEDTEQAAIKEEVKEQAASPVEQTTSSVVVTKVQGTSTIDSSPFAESNKSNATNDSSSTSLMSQSCNNLKQPHDSAIPESASANGHSIGISSSASKEHHVDKPVDAVKVGC